MRALLQLLLLREMSCVGARWGWSNWSSGDDAIKIDLETCCTDASGQNDPVGLGMISRDEAMVLYVSTIAG
jgi:hypothetical protein